MNRLALAQWYLGEPTWVFYEEPRNNILLTYVMTYYALIFIAATWMVYTVVYCLVQVFLLLAKLVSIFYIRWFTFCLHGS